MNKLQLLSLHFVFQPIHVTLNMSWIHLKNMNPGDIYSCSSMGIRK